MQLLPIVLVLALAAADGGLSVDLGAGRLDPGGRIAVTLGPIAAIVLVAALAFGRCHRRIRRGGDPRIFLTADRIGLAARWLLVAAHVAAVLLFGWLDFVRTLVGDLVIVDELVALVPPIAGLLVVWWLHYPIERRLREAVMIRRLDRGGPVYPMPSRRRYVSVQARSGLLLLLVPILMIFALDETIERLGAGAWHRPVATWVLEALTVVAALGVFLVSPLLARMVLTVRPLGAGAAREGLLDICRRHGVAVREVLLWQTGGSVINAAVMGLIGPLRYVLLTDALLELMDDDQVRAVMAHEVAHVRRHHMPWLVVTLLASISAVVLLSRIPLAVLGLDDAAAMMPIWAEMLLVALQLVLALVIFGWISRRFERQADTFAVQHLSGMGRDGAAPEPGVVTEEAAEAMRGALGRIAELNAIDPGRSSWRHGSIAWRRAYLRSLVGRPVAALPIDRGVRRIKVLAALVLAGAIAAEYALGGGAVTTGEASAGGDALRSGFTEEATP